MNKKIMFVLCTIFILCIGSMANAATSFKDIKNKQCEDSVNTLISLGIVNGYPEDNTYRPENTVTRAEMAKLMVVALGKDGKVAEATKNNSKFRDVKSSDWEVGYVNVASELGIINGYPDGSFRPFENMTRAQCCVMLHRLMEKGKN